MASEDVLKRVRSKMMGLVPPGHYDKVYKDECMLTFDTPFSPGGLYINLKTYQAFGEEALQVDVRKTQSRLYLHEKWTKVTRSITNNLCIFVSTSRDVAFVHAFVISVCLGMFHQENVTQLMLEGNMYVLQYYAFGAALSASIYISCLFDAHVLLR